MPAFSTRQAYLAGAACFLLSLTACSSSPDKFAPPCPRPSILREGSDLSRFNGRGRDIVDTVLEGRIMAINGTCTRDSNDVVGVTATVNIELTRGPAATSRTADISYFVAVLDGDRILDKQVFRMQPEFPPNTNRIRFDGDEIHLNLPVSNQKSSSAYRIITSFQLTPEELAVNRQKLNMR